ncbi:MAG TPA: hypothetical protein EYQ81_04835 [Sneathiellales bacterium]|nr:hypothetical protein [Sneathiellales bacterium]
MKVAVEAGADFVKYQSFRAERLVLPEAERSTYIVDGSYEGESFRDLLKRLELTFDQQKTLKKLCEEAGIKFLSTAFDPDGLDFLCEDLKCEVIKIASADLNNLRFLRHAATKKLPIILSTGMADLPEIDEAMDTLKRAGAGEVCLLHCVSWYPAAHDIINLRAMNMLADRYHVPVGYSDHTLGVTLPPTAVGMGATVIEKHYTMDPGAFGPDHAASLSPDELKTMVKMIREVEVALGSGSKSPSDIPDIELSQRRVHRRSVVTTKAIKKGETFSELNLDIKRPGTGIAPREFDEILGKKASVDIPADVLLLPDQIKT